MIAVHSPAGGLFGGGTFGGGFGGGTGVSGPGGIFSIFAHPRGMFPFLS